MNPLHQGPADTMRLSTKLLLISEAVLLLLVVGMIIPIRIHMRSQAVEDM